MAEYFCLATEVDYQTAQHIAHIGLIIIDNFVDSSMIFCQNRLWPCGEYKQVHSSKRPAVAGDCRHVGIYGIDLSQFVELVATFTALKVKRGIL